MAKIIDTSNKHSGGRKTLLLKAAIGLIGLILLAALIIFMIPKQNRPSWLGGESVQNQTTVDNTEQKVAEQQSKVFVSADTLMNNGYYDKAVELMVKTADDSKDNVDKAKVYVQLANLTLNQKKYDDAMKYAKKAEELRADYFTAQTIGTVALRKDDKEMAKDYLQKALDRVPENRRGTLAESAIKDLLTEAKK